jgi:hypothetical protein
MRAVDQVLDVGDVPAAAASRSHTSGVEGVSETAQVTNARQPQ